MPEALEDPVLIAGHHKRIADFIKEAIEQLSKKPRIEPRVPVSPGEVGYIPEMNEAARIEDARELNRWKTRTRMHGEWVGMTDAQRRALLDKQNMSRRTYMQLTPEERRAYDARQNAELDEAKRRSETRQAETRQAGQAQRVETAAQRRQEQAALREQAQQARLLARREEPVADVQPEPPPPPRGQKPKLVKPASYKRPSEEELAVKRRQGALLLRQMELDEEAGIKPKEPGDD